MALLIVYLMTYCPYIAQPLNKQSFKYIVDVSYDFLLRLIQIALGYGARYVYIPAPHHHCDSEPFLSVLPSLYQYLMTHKSREFQPLSSGDLVLQAVVSRMTSIKGITAHQLSTQTRPWLDLQLAHQIASRARQTLPSPLRQKDLGLPRSRTAQWVVAVKGSILNRRTAVVWKANSHSSI